MWLSVLVRHTTFRFCLDPTVEQDTALARHAGASRFASNTCLRLVKHALAAKQAEPGVKVPWTGFDLINAFNAWKKTEDAGRLFVVDGAGTAEVQVTGLAWRTQVCQQVFEEAAVDLGKGLAAFTASRKGDRAGRRVGFPRFKRKGRAVESFRLRNKHPKGGKPPIRVGDGDRPRSVTLPGAGAVKVHDDTRRLRRLIATGRGRILFATVSRRAGRWFVSLNVEAADLHQAQRHDQQLVEAAGFLGVDRGLHDLAVAASADGAEAARIPAPRHLQHAQAKQRRLARAVTRKPTGSRNRRKAAARLGRHHQQTRNRRHHVLHAAANTLAQYLGVPPLAGEGRRRRPQRERHARQPPPRSSHLRRRLDRTGPVDHLPAGLARRSGGHRGPVVPIVEDLLRLRRGRPGPHPRAAHLPVRGVRTGTGPRPQRSDQPRRVG